MRLMCYEYSQQQQSLDLRLNSELIWNTFEQVGWRHLLWDEEGSRFNGVSVGCEDAGNSMLFGSLAVAEVRYSWWVGHL